MQVRRAEKVRTVQRVKKTVLVKQVVSVRRAPVGRRASRPQARHTPHAPAPLTVHQRMDEIQKDYGEL